MKKYTRARYEITPEIQAELEHFHDEYQATRHALKADHLDDQVTMALTERLGYCDARMQALVARCQIWINAQDDVMTEDDQIPPKLAEFLLIAFTPARRAMHMIGDRNEVFARECKEFGRDRAVRRYWADTLRSLSPLLTRAIERALKWGTVIAAVRRLF
jgi:hypothetical protein